MIDDHSRNKSRTGITLAKDNYLDTGSRSYYGLQDQSLGASLIPDVIKPGDGATHTKQTSKKTFIFIIMIALIYARLRAQKL